jgi:hypothetical protein
MDTTNLSIPTNHTFAKIDLQRIEALMTMCWGDNSATRAVGRFIEDYEQHLHLLIDYRPVTPGHEALVPALVLRYFHAYLNLWVFNQLGTDRIVPFPAGVHDIWECLVLKSPNWEKPFPPSYTTSAAPLAPPANRGS